MIQLWPEQENTVELIREAYRKQLRAPLLVAPTGFGKTVVFSYIARTHVQKGGRVMILVHREELLEQVSETLNKFDVPHGIVSPNYPFSREHKVQVASVLTAVNRLGMLMAPTLLIVDEAHHCTGNTKFGRVLDWFRKAAFLGVTATPFRMGGEGLDDYFNALIPGPTVQQLIDAGRLSRFRVFCPSSPDLTSVHKRAGDYSAKELEKAIEHSGLTGDAVSHYKRLAEGKRGVAFCVSVKHAKDVAEDFNKAGYPAQAIDGGMPRDWRRDVIRDFRSGKLRILTSCDLISEGFDVPGIEVGISLRPTMSLGLWLQQFGRILRTFEGKKEAIMLDHAGNALRHGLPTDPREYSLQGYRATRQAERLASLKICKNCFAANPGNVRVCLDCGHIIPVKERKVAQRAGQLQELTDKYLEATRKARQVGMAKDMNALVELARKRGYRNPEGWAQHVWEGRLLKMQRKVAV